MRKIIAFILSVACVFSFASCVLNIPFFGGNDSDTTSNGTTDEKKESTNSVSDNNVADEKDSTGDSTLEEKDENNDLIIDGILYGGHINCGHINNNDFEDVCLSSSLISYKVQEMVQASEEYISFEIAISDIQFGWLTHLQFVEYVTISVINLSTPKDETILQTLDVNEFSSINYGFKKVQRENDGQYIKYNNYKKYDIPAVLLSGENGRLLFKISEHSTDSLFSSTAVVNYEYKDGNIYFSAV